MSDGGGDGGGDKGGGGGDKGGGGADVGSSTGDSSMANYTTSDPYSSVGSSSSFSDPTLDSTGFQGAGYGDTSTSGGSSLSDFVNDPSGGLNLTGPGTVGGDSGVAGAGGGSNTFSGTGSVYDNLPNLSGVDTSSFTGTGGGVTSAGDVTGGDSTGTALDFASTPTAGTSAASLAAPSGVSGVSDLTGLDQAENDTANQWGALNANSVPTATSSTGTGSSGSSTGTSGLSSLLPSSTNGLGAAVAGAGLLNNLINGNKSTDAMNQLNAQAAQNNALAKQLIAESQPLTDTGGQLVNSGASQVGTGTALQQYIATNTLPAGYEEQVQQAVSQQKAQIISNAAAQGLPTDPTKNSALAQQLAAVDNNVPAMREQLAASLATSGNSIVASGNSTANTGNSLSGNTLLQAGLQDTGISSGIYTSLANLENSQNQARASAIANFASALNGGANKGLTLNLGTKAA